MPAVISTASQVYAFVTHGISAVKEAVGDKDVTIEELQAIVLKEGVQAATIAALK